jgi:VWFA-related protein
LRIFAAAATAALLSVSGPALHPQQAQPPPGFKSGVELLTLQTSVLSKDGRPVIDLTAPDFSVTVEGKPRKVLFARFRGTAESSPAGTAAASAGPAAHIDNSRSAGGRLVMFVVDRDSIKKGAEKALLESGTAVLDALSPSDAAGLLSIPVGGTDPTRDHSRVREELQRVAGSQPAAIGGVQDRNITWDEALAFERGDQTTTSRVIERECRAAGAAAPMGNCPTELEAQARALLGTGRAHARTVLQALEGMLKALQPLRGPKHIVMISGGQAFDQELLIHYNEFARAAAAARVTLHAVHVDQPDSDVADRKTVSSAFGGRDMASGLTTMTGMTGGAYYSGVGRASGVFERIRTEIANDYELGIETTAGDADGRLREVGVKVNRPEVTVRARRQILLEKPGSEAPKDAVLTLLSQPTDLADLPIAVASYSTRGEEPASLKVLLSAEFGAPVSDWAFIVFDRGKVLADGRQQTAGETANRITTSLQLAPGRYRIRVAATAADGRAGVIDAPLNVGLRAAGPLQLSDVIVGTALSGRVQPQSRVFAGQTLAALLEIVSADVAALEKTRVAMEIIPAGAAEPARRVLMAARGGASSVVVLAEAQIDTKALPPGRYTASAIPLIDTQIVGRVSRAFEIVAETK